MFDLKLVLLVNFSNSIYFCVNGKKYIVRCVLEI